MTDITRFLARISPLALLGAVVLGAFSGCGEPGKGPVSIAEPQNVAVEPLAAQQPRGEEMVNVRVASHTSGNLEAFAIGATTGFLYRKEWAGTGWLPADGWQRLGTDLLFGVPAVVANGPHWVDVFAVHAGGDIYHYYLDTSDHLWHLEGLGGSVEGSPAAVAWSSSRLDLFAVGTADSALYHQAWSSGSTWTGWQRMEANIAGSPAVTSWGANRLDIFVVGAADNALYHKAWTGNAWSPATDGAWDRLSGTFTGTASAVSPASGRVDAFAVGQSDAALHHWAYDGTTFTPDLVGGQIVGSPTVTTWGPGRVDVAVTGAADGAAYHKALIGNTTWYPSDPNTWERLGGQIVGSPSAVSWGFQRYDVLVSGASDGAIYHKAWSASSSWVPCMNCDSWERLGAGFQLNSFTTPAEPWVILTCKFSDHPEDYPNAQTAMISTFSNSFSGNVADYYNSVSSGFVDISESSSGSFVENQWLSLGHTFASYFPNFCDLNDGGPQNDNHAIQQNVIRDCVQAYSVSPYFVNQQLASRRFLGVGVIVNFGNFSEESTIDGSAVGLTGSLPGVLIGSGVNGCGGGPTTTPASAAFEENRLAHELGHGLGLTHSHSLTAGATPTLGFYARNWDDEYGKGWDNEYGGGWDLMSCVSCSSFSQPIYGSSGPGLSAGHLSQLNWFQPSERFTYLGGTPIITLSAINQRQSGAYRFARIPVRGLPQHYYTVEFRTATAYDQGFANNPPSPAVVIYEVNPINDSVMQIQVKNGVLNGQYVAGDTYVDTAANVKISLLSIGTTTAVVRIGPAN